MKVYITKCEKSYYGKEWIIEDINVFKSKEDAKKYIKELATYFKKEKDLDIDSSTDDNDAYTIILKNGDLYNFVIEDEVELIDDENILNEAINKTKSLFK